MDRARQGLIFLFFSLILAAAPASPGFRDGLPPEEMIASLLAEMSDEELLGQLFMIGYPGTRPSEEILHWIRKRNLGGVKIFTRNVDSLAQLAADIRRMQDLARRGRLQIPLFISTDQEGGWVRNIKAETSVSPGNMALGASRLPFDAHGTGYRLGSEMRALGINMNFAPTIDVYANPGANVIGPRAISSDPRITAFLALAYYQGMSASGMICTAKHFPGHGRADQDSHGYLPVITASLEELWAQDLLPYRVLIPAGLPAIMCGHLGFPRILGDLTPSSLAPALVNGLLRERLKFQGVLITDDMEMNGVLAGGRTTAQACYQAVMAGNDMVLVSHTPALQEQAWDYLLPRLRSEPRFRERVKESARRVLTLKSSSLLHDAAGLGPAGGRTLGPAEGRTLSPAGAAARVAETAGENRPFFRDAAFRAVTLVRDRRIPLKTEAGGRILIAGQFSEFLEEGKKRFPSARTFLFPYDPFFSAEPQTLEGIRRLAASCDLILLCLANYNSLEVLQSLRSFKDRVVVISTLTPAYLLKAAWVETVVAVYGTGRESFQAGFAALAGDFIPEGRLPIELPH